MAEERCSNKVIVEGRHGLSRVHVSELHEGRFILGLEDERDAEVSLNDVSDAPVNDNNDHYLGYVLIFLILLAVIIYEGAPHAEVRYNRRMFFLSRSQVISAWARQ